MKRCIALIMVLFTLACSFALGAHEVPINYAMESEEAGVRVETYPEFFSDDTSLRVINIESDGTVFLGVYRLRPVDGKTYGEISSQDDIKYGVYLGFAFIGSHGERISEETAQAHAANYGISDLRPIKLKRNNVAYVSTTPMVSEDLSRPSEEDYLEIKHASNRLGQFFSTMETFE